MPKKGVKKDTISALKQNEEKNKKKEENQNIDEYSDKSDEEEETKAGIVKEQSVQKKDEPKSLKDLLDSEPIPNEKTEQSKKINNKPQNKNQKPKFLNSKYSGNINAKYDKEAKRRNENQQKKNYNVKGIDNIAIENSKIKPTKNYLEKEDIKKYTEDKEEEIAKPEFKNLKIGKENFVELNKNEDLFAKNMESKNFEIKNEYNAEKEKEKERKVREKKYYEKKEITNDVDSDGFEIVGSKEDKRNYYPKKKYWHKKKKLL
jgi:aarF domain-containing kinase